MTEKEQQREYRTVIYLVSTLANICASPPNQIIDALTGVVWDEEEAGMLAESGAALLDYYKIKIDGKRGAMLALLWAVTLVYGPRIVTIVIAARNKPEAAPDDANPSQLT